MKTHQIPSVQTLVLIALLAHGALAQVPISVGTYNQSFDSLAASGTSNPWTDNSTLPGWYATRSKLGGVTVYQASPGTGNSGALYSFGTNPPAERALGSLASGTPGNLAYALYFTNDTGSAQSDISVTYTGEQWRNGGVNSQQQLFADYRVSATPVTLDTVVGDPWNALPALDFYGPTYSTVAGPLDGNNPTNRQLFNNVSLSGVTVQPGEILVLRWLDVDDTGGDHGLAIDDLSVVFPGVIPVTNRPAITAQPQSRTNNAGTDATFSVTVTGTEPLSYQWRRNGEILSDGGNIVGSANATLTVNNVLKSDEAVFDVIVTNIAGAQPSLAATLTVIDPAINSQPLSRTNVSGDYASISVSASGTGTLRYQWQHDGASVPGETSSSYQITNVVATNAGRYLVVITNSLGSVTSAVAMLTVIPTPPVRFAHWNFNDTNAPSIPDAPAIAFGTGTAAPVGGTGGAFVSGSSSDPSGPGGGNNFGWNTTNYPAQGTANKTAGAQFNVNTAGYTNVYVTWQQRHSGTASKYVRFQYSLNGNDFVDQNVYSLSADSVFIQLTNDLKGIPGAANNANFAFRIVTEWESTATGSGSDAYLPTFANYGSAGTIRFEMLNLFGDALGAVVRPEIDDIRFVGGDVQIDFTAGVGDAASAFTVVSSVTVNGEYANTAATIVSLGGGKFRATLTSSGSQRFYQIKR